MNRHADMAFEPMTFTNAAGSVRVEWVDLGEGWSGDFDPEDPDDVSLLRFDVEVFEDGEWVSPYDASYCTRMPIDTDRGILMKGLQVIASEVERAWPSGSVKKPMERMSWLCPEDFQSGEGSASGCPVPA